MKRKSLFARMSDKDGDFLERLYGRHYGVVQQNPDLFEAFIAKAFPVIKALERKEAMYEICGSRIDGTWHPRMMIDQIELKSYLTDRDKPVFMRCTGKPYFEVDDYHKLDNARKSPAALLKYVRHQLRTPGR